MNTIIHEVMIDGVRYVPANEPTPPSSSEQKFNAAAFFDYIREHLFRGSLTQSQVDGINLLGKYLEQFFSVDDLRRVEKCAYCMATFQWETASTMQPIEEYGGPNARYAPWYGRGFVQLTWEENYVKQQNKLRDMDYVQENDIPYAVHDDRDLALHPDTSALISIGGMRDGDFTGVGLEDYINENQVDYIEARRIVNGTDRQHEIADMARHYERAFRLGLEG